MLTTYLKSGNKQMFRTLQRGISSKANSVNMIQRNVYRNQMMMQQLQTRNYSIFNANILRAQNDDNDEQKDKAPKGFEKFFRKDKDEKKSSS